MPVPASLTKDVSTLGPLKTPLTATTLTINLGLVWDPLLSIIVVGEPLSEVSDHSGFSSTKVGFSWPLLCLSSSYLASSWAVGCV